MTAPKPRAYRLLSQRFGHPAGTLVYEQMFHDYGLASDDTRATGVEHISVTLNSDGGYPGFTAAVSQLQALSDNFTPWAGGPCPVAPGAIVSIQMRDGSTFAGRPARIFDWAHVKGLNCAGNSGIVGYRVLSATADYPSLPALAETPGMLAQALARMTAQRDELLAALQAEVEIFKAEGKRPLTQTVAAIAQATPINLQCSQPEACRPTNDPHDGAPVCMTCDARVEGGAL